MCDRALKLYKELVQAIGMTTDIKAINKAIVETFKNRNTPLTSDIEAFSFDFYNDQTHILRWNAFVKKKKIELNISLKETVLYIKDLIIPILSNK